MDAELHHRDEAGERLPFLVVRLPEGARVLSSAPVGGGLGERRWVLNAQVPTDYARTDLAAHVDELRRAAGLPPHGGVGLFTGAHVPGATTHDCGGVRAIATVGVSEPEWAAAPAKAAATTFGTINVIVWVPVALAPAALANAVITATEAKTQAMVEAGLPGSGTATDAVCIACPGSGAEEPFAGPRSVWGHRLAVAVHATVAEGIARAEAAA